MKITNDDVRKFQAIWQEEFFKEDINEDEARYHIARLDALYLMLYKPGTKLEARMKEALTIPNRLL